MDGQAVQAAVRASPSDGLQARRRPCWTRVLLLASAAVLGLPASAVPAPEPLTLPPNAQVGAMTDMGYDEAEIPLPAQREAHLVRGRVWRGEMRLVDHGLGPAPTATQVWSRLSPAMQAGGWQLVHGSDEGQTLRWRRGARDVWAYLGTRDPEDIGWVMVDTAGRPRSLRLAAPGPHPETLRDNAAIPYLAPLPGMTPISGQRGDEPFTVVLDGSGQPQVVAERPHVRFYGGPETAAISPLELAAVYESALKGAGWQVLRVERGGLGAQRAEVLARYQGQGRDLWARVSGGSTEFRFDVADAGADDIVSALKRDCRAVLTGVFFDNDRATLKPDSEAALQRAVAALRSVEGRSFEVQGHTDNVGTPAHNQPLSEARAASVKAWLVAHGVPAARLIARGFGATRPVAPNDGDLGRARNRRVELACVR